MTRQFLLPFLFAIGILSASSASAQPFGISEGTSLSSLNVNTSPPVEPGAGNYVLSSVPKPHKEFVFYTVQAGPNVGVCTILAIGKSYLRDAIGKGVLAAFERLRDQLESVYGKSALISSLTPNSDWDGSDEWVMSIYKEERQHKLVWAAQVGSDLKENVASILLTVAAANRDTSHLLLQYQFQNNKTCAADIMASEASAL